MTANVFSNLFVPSPDSLLALRRQDEGNRRQPHWFPWLMLVWSIWIFITPLMNVGSFPHWRTPTFASYAVFLALFHRAYYRNRALMPWWALSMAAIGFALTPINPGAQGYLIYACAFLAFCLPPRRAVAAMVVVLALYSVEWLLLLGWSWLFLTSAVVVGLAVGLMNISQAQRMQADVALKLSHEEVRRLAALAERERIGRDLHDLLGHTLSLVALKSELAGKLVASDPASARREIGEVTRVAREALTQVRSAVTGIRAAGLAAELASARLLLETDAIAFRYAVTPAELSKAQELAFAMTLRESVTNIQRHARARSAQVCLQADAGEHVLRITDDGRGGDIAPGNGLRGMRERIEALGGRLRIESSAAGTCVEARLPMQPATAIASPLRDAPAAAA
jgi:two-component system sensor histidine kinase DesK